jgi:Ca-activated chloride channel homolog
MFLKVRGLCSSLIILLSIFLYSDSSLGSNFDDIRIDVPADGRVHVENRFGDVNAEVWDKQFVSVSAVVTGPTSSVLKRSPILIDNRGTYLSISAVRVPINSIAAIDLIIKIPSKAHLEVSTAKGKISLRGLSASALLKSGSGDIKASINQPLNVNLTARAARGVISSGFPSGPAPDDHVWQARLGPGSERRTLDAQTETGRITLAPMNSEQSVLQSSTQDSANRQQPELVGANSAGRSAGTPASPNAPSEVDEGDVIRVDSQLVTLNMSVVDRNTRRGFQGLRREDFQLFEDGEQQNILQFDSSSAPFDLILLMDLSGSTKDVIKLIRAAALRFVDAARPADRIAVITFAGEANLVSGLTGDRALLHDRINTIDTARGDTKLYDATAFAMSEVAKDAKKSRRTAIILMSDGLDGTIPGVSGQRGSVMPYQEVLRTIEEFDGVLYTLWLNTEYQAFSPLDTQPEAFDAGHDRMKEMAEAGGGIFYEVERLTDLAGAYEQVVADLGTVYSLAYRPSNKTRDGKWRAIKITVNRSNAVARGKRGYYAN